MKNHTIFMFYFLVFLIPLSFIFLQLRLKLFLFEQQQIEGAKNFRSKTKYKLRISGRKQTKTITKTQKIECSHFKKWNEKRQLYTKYKIKKRRHENKMDKNI